MAESRITIAQVYGEVSKVQQDVARLRGELNGSIPRMASQVDKLAELLQRQQEEARDAREQARLNEAGLDKAWEAIRSKADDKANEEAHRKVYFFIRLSLYAMAGAVGLMALKQVL